MSSQDCETESSELWSSGVASSVVVGMLSIVDKEVLGADDLEDGTNNMPLYVQVYYSIGSSAEKIVHCYDSGCFASSVFYFHHYCCCCCCCCDCFGGYFGSCCGADSGCFVAGFHFAIILVLILSLLRILPCDLLI